MKKIISFILASLMILTVFAGCSAKEKDKDMEILPSEQVVTEGAVIKEMDAVEYIENNYTKEELGLDKTEEKYSLMIAGNGVEYEGEKYVKVVANVVTENTSVTAEDGSPTFTMKTISEFLISFDGKTVLKRNLGDKKYTKLESKVADYSAKGGAASQAK